jgi:hypothetical protein
MNTNSDAVNVEVTRTHLLGHAVTELQQLPAQSVDLVITSPPYWGQRHYPGPVPIWADGCNIQLGQESQPTHYVFHLVEVMGEIRRVLKKTGSVWVNLGDTYNSEPSFQGSAVGPRASRSGPQSPGRVPRKANIPKKSLMGMPWRFALAMIDAGWVLREDIIWSKPNPMPESVRDRCTRAHEYIFHFSQSGIYFWDYSEAQEPAVTKHGTQVTGYNRNRSAESVLVKGPVHSGLVDGYLTNGVRNKRSVWTVPVRKGYGSHYATFPMELIRPIVRMSCPPGGVVLDPFGGVGTTAIVASQEQRSSITIEIDTDYFELTKGRVSW